MHKGTSVMAQQMYGGQAKCHARMLAAKQQSALWSSGNMHAVGPFVWHTRMRQEQQRTLAATGNVTAALLIMRVEAPRAMCSFATTVPVFFFVELRCVRCTCRASEAYSSMSPTLSLCSGCAHGLSVDRLAVGVTCAHVSVMQRLRAYLGTSDAIMTSGCCFGGSAPSRCSTSFWALSPQLHA